jgi:hypothetical protein
MHATTMVIAGIVETGTRQVAQISTQGMPTSVRRRSVLGSDPWVGQITSPSTLYSRMLAIKISWAAGSSRELLKNTVLPALASALSIDAVSSEKYGLTSSFIATPTVCVRCVRKLAAPRL